MDYDAMFEKVLNIIDGACWDARSFGHDDNGLDDELDCHPSAYTATREIMKLMEAD